MAAGLATCACGLARASVHEHVHARIGSCMRMWLEPQGSRPRKEGGTTLQRIRPPAAATAAVDLPASMSEVVVEVEEVVEVAKAVEAVEVAKAVEVVEAEVVVEVIVEVAEAVEVAVEVAPAAAVVEGPAAATGWPAAAVDVPAAGTCGGTCSPPGGCLSPLSACCGTCCGAPQPTHALALGASSHGSCDGHVHVHVHVHVHTVVAWMRDATALG